jgi:hypothetical protein
MGMKPPGMEKYSEEELANMSEMLARGEMPPQLQGMADMLSKSGASQIPNMKDKDGNPCLDSEGGWFIQPDKGFVVKTKDQTGQKVFVNMTSHEIIDPFEEKAVPIEQ